MQSIGYIISPSLRTVIHLIGNIRPIKKKSDPDLPMYISIAWQNVHDDHYNHTFTLLFVFASGIRYTLGYTLEERFTRIQDQFSSAFLKCKSFHQFYLPLFVAL